MGKIQGEKNTTNPPMKAHHNETSNIGKSLSNSHIHIIEDVRTCVNHGLSHEKFIIYNKTHFSYFEYEFKFFTCGR